MKCILCGGGGNSTLFSVKDRLNKHDREYRVRRCSRCASIQIDPLPCKDEIAGMYPDNYAFTLNEETGGLAGLAKSLEWALFYRPIYERSYRLIANTLGREAFRIFDIGCGSGLRMQVFRGRGCEVGGNEISKANVENARKLLGDCVCEGMIEDIDAGENEFDVVSMFALIEHVVDPASTMVSARKLLKDDGLLVVQAPVVDSIQYAMLSRRAASVREMPRHVFIPSVKGLVSLAQERGYSLVRYYPISVIDSSARFSLGLFPGSSACDAYGGGAAFLARSAGWALALFPGTAIGVWEHISGTAIENIFIFRKNNRLTAKTGAKQ